MQYLTSCSALSLYTTLSSSTPFFPLVFASSSPAVHPFGLTFWRFSCCCLNYKNGLEFRSLCLMPNGSATSCCCHCATTTTKTRANKALQFMKLLPMRLAGGKREASGKWQVAALQQSCASCQHQKEKNTPQRPLCGTRHIHCVVCCVCARRHAH